MAGKKKKGKKKKKDKSKGPPKLVVPNFVPVHREKMPIAVKVHHFDENFLVLSDSYEEPSKIIEQLSLILKKDPDSMNLYFLNKREVELTTVNHDQQIQHNTNLYLRLKNEDVWESIKDVVSYNIYDIDIESVIAKKEEEKRVEQERLEEEEKKRKEEEEKDVLKKYRLS